MDGYVSMVARFYINKIDQTGFTAQLCRFKSLRTFWRLVGTLFLVNACKEQYPKTDISKIKVESRV